MSDRLIFDIEAFASQHSKPCRGVLEGPFWPLEGNLFDFGLLLGLTLDIFWSR